MKNNHPYTKVKSLFSMIICLLVVLLAPRIGFADTTSELNFHVQPILPASQLEGGSNGYFDLNLEPGATDQLALEFYNHTEETITVQVSAHTAYTNINGVVEYGKDAEEPDPTLPASLAEMIDAPGEITLQANEKKTVAFAIHMPKEAYDGVLAGGIRIEEVRKEEETEKSGEGLAIKNAFSYVVGVVVSNNRSATEPGLDLLEVFADQVNYRNVFSAMIQNYTPTFVNKLSVKATVQKEGENEVLYEAHQEGMQMAPNSHFNFPIPLNGDRFQSGNYVLKMTAHSNGEEWTWEQKFTVETDDARRLNREDVTVEDEVNWWLIAAISVIFLLVTILGYVLYKQKKPN